MRWRVIGLSGVVERGVGEVDVENLQVVSGRTSSTPRNSVSLVLDLWISIEGMVFLTRMTTPPLLLLSRSVGRFHIL